MSLWSTLEQQRVTFDGVLADLTYLKNETNPPTDRFDGLIAAVRNISTMLNDLKSGRSTGSGPIVQTHKQLLEAVRGYRSASRGLKLPGTEGWAVERLFSVTEQYTKQTLKPLRESVDAISDDTDGFSSIDTDDLKEWYGRRLTMFAVDENAADSSGIKNTVGRVLWVGENISLAERVNQITPELQNSQPYKQYETAVRKMEEDTPENQIRYARLLANRELQLTEKVNQAYQTLVERYGNGADGVRKALEALVNDESYRAARSYSALKERLMRGPMGTPIRLASEKIVAPIVQRDLDVMNLVNGTLEDTLTQNYGQSGREAVQHAREKDMKDFRAAGLPINDFSAQLFDLATRFAADKDHSASPFYAIASQIFKLEKMDQENLTDPAYRKQLRSCYFTAQSYLDNHLHPFFQKGRNRREIAQAVADLIDNRLQSLQPNDNEIELGGEDPDIERARQARLLGHVGTAQITTMLPRERREVAAIRTDKEARGDLHGFYNCVVALEQVTTGLIANIIGAIMWLYQKLKGKSAAERDAVPYDAEHVPFMREEKYREPEGDNIITDKRRIPLVWERRIAEEPDQPITLTFEVDQPYEGNNVGMGLDASNVGHAFLTLKYSKKNPATGKLERYKTSFGFYPKPVLGEGSAYLAATIGSFVPGRIKEDFDHPVSVGATVNITPQQFNDIIRFTGSYEKGGYNMTTRNCTDFALEAVRHAGVVIPELEKVQKVDVTSNAGLYEYPVLGVVDLFAGHLLKRELAKNDIRNHLETRDTSQYSRIGQAEATKEDIERCNHAELNMRLRGHVPGATAEAIRGSFGFALHSKKYVGTEATREKAYGELTAKMRGNLEERGISAADVSSDKKKIESFHSDEKSLFFLNLIQAQGPLLRRQIETVFAPISEDLKNVLNKMDTYHQEVYESVKDLLRTGLNVEHLQNADMREGAMKCMREGAKAINGYVTDLNNIFHNVFKSDPRMNIPFQNMVSLCEQLTSEIDFAYDTACNMLPLIDLDENNAVSAQQRKNLQKLEQQLYDQNRDASHAIWEANHAAFYCTIPNNNGGESKRYKTSPASLLATMLSFDDPLDALRRFCYEPKEEQTMDMGSLMITTTSALTTLQDGHEYSDPELNAVFCRLPKLERTIGADGLSFCYQTMALTAILGDGFLGDMIGDINEKFRAKLDEKRSQLECTIDLDMLRDRTRKYNDNRRKYGAMEPGQLDALTGADKAAYQKYLAEGQALSELPTLEVVQTRNNNMRDLVMEFSESAWNLLNDNLKNLEPKKLAKLKHLAEIMANDLIKERGATTAEDKNACRRDAWTNLGTSITQGYLYSICEKAMNPMIADDNLRPAAIRVLSMWKMGFNPRIPDLIQTEMQRVNAPRQSVRQAGPAQQNDAANRPEQQGAPVQGRQQRSNSVANRAAPQNDPNQGRPRSNSVKSSGPVK